MARGREVASRPTHPAPGRCAARSTPASRDPLRGARSRVGKAGHKHDIAHQHDDIDPLPFPGAPEPPFRDLPGRQVLDPPQRAWWEQAEQGHRAVQMVNRRASVIATTL